ncbi:hypothetical protein [Arthrobacter oryzae]|uniref:hypothetical protein n=1 Tax=Arthrobacter oryzae TaxID=409290 RepID=UPI00273C951A|nr:hypothetical protein [Arthrobacter oryzae]WLQ05107.1 hypothetical protein Q8Z05_13230 [Arthrobacter oryzae]
MSVNTQLFSTTTVVSSAPSHARIGNWPDPMNARIGWWPDLMKARIGNWPDPMGRAGSPARG